LGGGGASVSLGLGNLVGADHEKTNLASIYRLFNLSTIRPCCWAQNVVSDPV